MKDAKKIIIASVAGVVGIAVVVAIITVVIMLMSKEYRLVKVETFDGSVTVERASEKDVMDVFEGMNLISKDVVTVGNASGLEILVDTDKHLYAEENTVFGLTATGDENSGKIKIDIMDGSALFEIENKLNSDSSFSVATPNAVFSVRGTEFRVDYDEETGESQLLVYKGVVAVDYEDGRASEEVNAGEGRLITADDIEIISVDEVEAAVDAVDEIADTSSDIDIVDDAQAVDVSADGWVSVDGNSDSAIVSAYNDIIANMGSYIQGVNNLNKDYVSRDYIYYDYDQDGRKEVILYLKYFDADNRMILDLAFLDYFEESGQIGVRAVNTGDVDDQCYYGEYNGRMARYSWRTDPYESYLYSVYVDESNQLIYVLEAGFDEILTDYDKTGTPLPLYGEWEMIFE